MNARILNRWSHGLLWAFGLIVAIGVAGGVMSRPERTALAADAKAAVAEPAVPAATPAAVAPAPKAMRDACVICHSMLDGDGKKPTIHIADDIHIAKGMHCTDCHGGNWRADPADLDQAHDEKMGWHMAPKREQQTAMCAKCHSSTARMAERGSALTGELIDEYTHGPHGSRVDKDKDVATCTDCHGVHGIRAHADPLAPTNGKNQPQMCGKCHGDTKLMAKHGIWETIIDDYATSVHYKSTVGGMKDAGSCSNCHSAHAKAPKGITDMGTTCQQCHSSNYDAFAASPHAKAFSTPVVSPTVHVPVTGCIVCHGPHGVQSPPQGWLGMGDKSICRQCHAIGSSAGNAAAAMADSVRVLRERVVEAKDFLKTLNPVEHQLVSVEGLEAAIQDGDAAVGKSRGASHGATLASLQAIIGGPSKGLVEQIAASKASRVRVQEEREYFVYIVGSLLLMVAGLVLFYLEIRARRATAGRA